jgi:hypothetical protein
VSQDEMRLQELVTLVHTHSLTSVGFRQFPSANCTFAIALNRYGLAEKNGFSLISVPVYNARPSHRFSFSAICAKRG